MDAAARQKHRVARLDWNAVETIGHAAVRDFSLELRPGHPCFEAGIQAGAGGGVGDEPHFRLRLALQSGGLICGRMDLQGKFVPRIQDFAEQREASCRCRAGAAEQFSRVLLHQPAQSLAGQRSVGDDAGVTGPVADFPGFPDAGT